MFQILIVEDEIRVAAFIEKGLKKNGFKTTVAEDGQKALLLAESGDFDLMLLDLGLPIVDGLTVLQEIRHRGVTNPIIIVTAQKDDNQQAIALKYGADAYITKPFRFVDLLTRIKSFLEGSD